MRLTQEITDEIDQLLLKNQEKLSLGQRKQLLKKIDILEVLHSKGYDIGYTTVCNYISSKSKRVSEKRLLSDRVMLQAVFANLIGEK
ncbi:hypothetical protein [Labilibaculum manganireducens]|uniref:hypothetical protein n=1 Tax=Labilibaculum manganireducens TaxID=1940525 RepID=UPI0029F55F76|nr:hypothetical protein [Labilibaculum manganireducens]